MVSVVPEQSDRIRAWARKDSGVRLVELSAVSRLPFRMDYETPLTLGADRVAAAAGAWVRRGDPGRGIIAVDAGTAVTVDAVTSRGVYLGGLIAPGPELLRKALHDGTAQLPLVELEPGAPLIGRTTVEAIQSGIMNGFAASVEGVVQRMAAELEGSSRLYLTGGWSAFLRSRIKQRSFLVPDLVLEGVRVLYELHEP
jgi:type III pantothenate kinase